MFIRRPPGAKINRKNKNANPVRLPPRLLAHVRRWDRMGLMQVAVVGWNGKTVKRIKKPFAIVCRIVGLEGVTPYILRHYVASVTMSRTLCSNLVF